jgi:hypothetical protein
MTKSASSQGYRAGFNIHKPINLIQNINRNKEENHLITSVDTEKAINKIQHHIMIKALRKLGIEGVNLNIVQAIYEKPTGNIILKAEKLKPLPLKSGMRQGCPPSSLLST